MKKFVLSVAAIVAVAGAASAQGVRVFDNMTGNSDRPAPNPQAVYIPASSTTTGSGAPLATAGNWFMGQSINLDGTNATANSLIGLDLTVLNATGAVISSSATLRVNYWVWGASTNQTSGTTPAFSNLLQNGSANVALTGLGGTGFANNSFLSIAGPNVNTPGITFGTPIAVAGFGNIAITYSIQIDAVGLGTFTNTNGLTVGITGGAAPNPVAVAPAVGSYPTFFNGVTPATVSGYYRSLNGGTDFAGNFQQSSWRQIGANSGVLTRVYAVPAPGAAALLGLGGLLAARRRRA